MCAVGYRYTREGSEPMVHRALLRRFSLAGLLVLACLALSLPAGAANRPTITFVSPSPSEGATLTSNSVSFAFTYNRKPKQTQTLTCSLSGPTSSSGPCDAPVASGTGSRSGKSYSGLANGSYTFSVLLTLTDGGTATASRQFTINVPVRHVYWTNFDANTIGRADLDGQNVNQSFISGASGPFGLAVDSG